MKIPIKILFQNENFVIVDKPPLTLSVPARFADDDRPVVGTILQQQLKVQVFPTHRLDFEVSGLLLFALSAPAHSQANQWFEHKSIQKTYQAFSAGIAPAESKMQWRSQLLRGKKRAYESPVGKESLTQACFIKKCESYLLWDLQPITGRAHQLRYEMAKHGFPIVGDVLYGSTETWPQGIALRAYKIDFPVQAKEWDLPEKFEIAGWLNDAS